ncbi:MAG: GTP cyclohydrolase I FolE2 [Thermoplasmata archaeon]|nr:MAG: GTP cyclohydrolase I FolE2 [Thermoplasmata archaeon]RLF34154.1 MAG: GTP cyclohydrolase I FolE2 [Thermoplasmata archaeon]
MNTVDLPDVQSRVSSYKFKLTRVGVTGVKKLVHVKRPNRDNVIPLVVTMDLFVDLPASQKGSHMSRNLELISEIIDSNIQKPVSDLETLCAKTAELLLKRHEYATFSEVKAEGDYFLERTYPSGKKGMEPYKIIAEAKAEKKGETKKLIGVKVVGMTTCPCAMEVVQKLEAQNKKTLSPTHNQRNMGTLMIEIPRDNHSVDADDLIEIVEKAFSSPTYSILKRKEEGELVINAHRKPKFVEDVVRDMLRAVLKKYKHLPDDILVIARSESEESIHKHNAFAERITTLGELRK